MSEPTAADTEERALIGACLLQESAVEESAAIVEASDFHGLWNQSVYRAIVNVWASGTRPDPVTVAAAVSDRDDVTVEALHRLMLDTPAVSNASRYAVAVADAATRRRLVMAADEITRLAVGQVATEDAGEAADRARALLAGIDLPAGNGPPDPGVDEWIGSTDMRYDWLIPGVLERGDRLLITSAEGRGKSLLCAQLGLQTAAGIHPWVWSRRVAPRNVLLIDLENGSRLVARRLAKLREHVDHDFDGRHFRVHTRPQGIDLTSRTGRRWLLDRVEANRAELLVVGPAYRMSAGPAARGDVGGEDQARQVTGALDEVRHRTGAAIILETHAPHGDRSGGRDLRPFGSSVWLRWPEFGIGLAPDKNVHHRWLVKHWRGARDSRQWPMYLEWGVTWPWLPTLAQRDAEEARMF